MKTETLLLDQLTPITIYHKIKSFFKEELVFLYESAVYSAAGNFSFFFIGTRERITYKNGSTTYIDENNVSKKLTQSPFSFLKEYYKNIDTKRYKDLASSLDIGFVDGFVGYVGYDTIMEFEPTLVKSMKNLHDELDIPDIDLIRPKLISVFSHKTNKLTIVSTYEKVYDTIEPLIEHLKQAHTYMPLQQIKVDDGHFFLSKESFFEGVAKSKEHIKDGDIFQILFSNRYTTKTAVEPLSFYRVLRSTNPSPYMFLLEFEDFSIVGSSPEVMIKLKDNHIILRPIAGTRKRGKDEEQDLQMENELVHDEKERAEHLMLIDLGRNDVGRVAKPKSVHVSDMMRVERYSHVMHLVSDVEATLDEKYDMFDLFGATFTAGTMTGAPKIKAMELIAEFEKLKRSFFSGVVGYFGFDGNMDSAIMIRTAYLDKEKTIFQAGAGIVADSIDEFEYLEVHNKLAAMMNTLEILKK